MSTAQTEDQDADMLAGFGSEDDDQSDAGTKADQPPGSSPQPQGAATEPAGQQEPEAAPAADQNPGAEPQTDPFAALPEAVRNLLAKVPELETRAATADERSRRAEGQVRSMQSQLAKLTAQPPAAAPTPAPQRLAKLEHARESVGTDMPEVLEALDELAALIPSQTQQKAEAPAPEAVTAPPAQAPEQTQSIDPVTQAHFEALDMAHPGWFETLESTDAKLWLASHPEMAAKYSRADTAMKLSEVLTGFKAYRQQTQTAQSTAQARQTRMAAGVLPQGNSRAPARLPPGSEEDGMAAGFTS